MTAASRTVRIGSSHGLHARPAKLFAQAAKESGIAVTVAKDSGKPVTIHVEKYNPAMRLYERLGFTPSADRGVYVLLERPPHPVNK